MKPFSPKLIKTRSRLASLVGAVIVIGGGGFIVVHGGGGGGGAETANIWVDTSGGTCARNASPAAYSDAAACGSITAAWTAASAGDLILVKGGTYTGAFAATGSKASTTTIQAAATESPHFAGEGTLNSVTNMTVQDDRPVNVVTEAGVADGLTMAYTTIGGTSANIVFHNVDVWCQNASPYHVLTGGQGTSCTAPFVINGVSGFTWNNGSEGPSADCGGDAGQLTCTGGRTDISKITFCTSNATCQNIAFNNVLWHDSLNLDGTQTGRVHHEMIKIDQGQNITFNGNKFIRCNFTSGSCDSAVIFLGQSGSSPTANNISFIGSAFGPAGNASFSSSHCSPTPCSPTFIFKYNSDYNGLSPEAGLSSYANMQFIGNASWKPSFFCPVISGATFTKNTWFTLPGQGFTASTCGAGDNPGITNANLATLFTDYANGNWLPPTGSPLISAGGTGCTGLTDYAGTARPSGTCDAGAIEKP